MERDLHRESPTQLGAYYLVSRKIFINGSALCRTATDQGCCEMGTVLFFPLWRYIALGAPPPGALALPFVPTTIANQLILKPQHKAAQANAQHLADIP